MEKNKNIEEQRIKNEEDENMKEDLPNNNIKRDTKTSENDSSLESPPGACQEYDTDELDKELIEEMEENGIKIPLITEIREMELFNFYKK